jgi:hypothetical protein
MLSPFLCHLDADKISALKARGRAPLCELPAPVDPAAAVAGEQTEAIFEAGLHRHGAALSDENAMSTILPGSKRR